MNTEKLESRIGSLELKILMLLENQKEFHQNTLMKLSLENKEFYSNKEAAAFLDLKPEYIYQLVNKGLLKKIKNDRIKKQYFLKTELINYIKGETSNELENEILNKWNKKSIKPKKA